MDLQGIVAKLTQFQPLAAYAQRLVDGEFRWPRQGKNNDKAHPPIHPVAPGNNLTGDAKRVYEFITRRFLACCSDNAKGQATEVDAELAHERFFTNGLMILARNYLDIYPYERWSESTVPVYRQGDTFTPTVFEMRSGTTTAPKLLTEGELVKIMDRNGIGTDATYADHIKKIIDREYIFKGAHGLSPSTLGVGLVEGYDAIGLELSLTKPHLRREMEQELRKICLGHKHKQDVVRETLHLYQAVYTKSANEIEKLELALGRCMGVTPTSDPAWQPSNVVNADVCMCPQCPGSWRLRARQNGSWMVGCDRYPQCRRAVWVPDVVENMQVSEVACSMCVGNPRGPAKLLEIVFRQGSVPPGVPTPYQGCVRGCDELISEIFGSNSGGGGGGNPAPPNTAGRPASHQNQLPPPSRPVPHQNPLPHAAPYISRPPTPGQSDNPQCYCNQSSKRLVTQKPGPNKGRAFFKCARAADAQCDFFHWADQPTNSSDLFPVQSGSSALPDLYSVHASPPQPKPKCKCGLFASLKQTSESGANPGREYYACTKAYQGCGFLCWKEDAEAYMGGAQIQNAAGSQCYRGAKQNGSVVKDVDPNFQFWD
ncbi:DNA topoisomerase 3-alpha [Linderina pennispora]|nr:DNA topoisomerase 3-alpha [Linderina pennispora]